jgi:hypothetical protein
MFLREACPVHTENLRKLASLYWDGCWPSDQYPLLDEDGNGFSVVFIPGRLSDHKLLDDKYVYRLHMMTGSLSAAMEQGCWCERKAHTSPTGKRPRWLSPTGWSARSGGMHTS